MGFSAPPTLPVSTEKIQQNKSVLEAFTSLVLLIVKMGSLLAKCDRSRNRDWFCKQSLVLTNLNVLLDTRTPKLS